MLFEKIFFVKEKSYNVTSSAIMLNKIDISTLAEISEEPIEIINDITFIRNEFFNGEPMTIVGHNIGFDSSFLKQLYKKYDCDYCRDFSHRMIDTASILRYLYYAGKLEFDLSSSDKAFDFFNISIKNRHSALDDCKATMELFQKLIRI